MIKQFGIILILFTISCKTNYQNKKNKNMNENKFSIQKTDEQWKELLSEQEYYVLREKGTDRPSDGGYTNHFEKGTYICRACKTPLFPSESKYKSHCGWPSFDNALEGKIIYKKDTSHNMIRTEIICGTCGGHLGHIFDDGPRDTTGKRYCVNTSSIKFIKE
jgi:peptide-methionine (R)-S-oxide reductase